MVLYVVRHGETEANVKNLFNGINSLDLTETGIQQAKNIQSSIKKLDIDYIFCSPLKRTIHTANILNVKNKQIYIDKRLIERECGEYTLKPISLIKDLDLLYDKNTNHYQEFEPFSSILERVSSFIQDLKENYKSEDNILIVTHGDVIRGFQEYFNTVNDVYPKNCELLKFKI